MSTYALLLGANGAVWLLALALFERHPVLLGTAALAYAFGLRHAIDPDHICAIDNVTRHDRRHTHGARLRLGVPRAAAQAFL